MLSGTDKKQHTEKMAQKGEKQRNVIQAHINCRSLIYLYHTDIWGVIRLKDEKIILPKDVQIRLMKFFLKTSIPRKAKQEKATCLNKKQVGKE